MVAPQSAEERGFAHGRGWVRAPDQSIHNPTSCRHHTHKQAVSRLQSAPRVLLAHLRANCRALVSQVKGESAALLNCALRAAAYVT